MVVHFEHRLIYWAGIVGVNETMGLVSCYIIVAVPFAVATSKICHNPCNGEELNIPRQIINMDSICKI